MDSLILRTATSLLVALMLVFSVFLLLRGHNEPGGGFIGALVAATAFALYALAHGPSAVRRAVRVDPLRLAMAGLAVALASGLIGLVRDAPFLTGVWNKVTVAGAVLPLGSPVLFDIGVFLAVLGAVLTMILAIEEED